MNISTEAIKYEAIHTENEDPFYEISNEELEKFINYMLKSLLVEKQVDGKTIKLESVKRDIFPEDVFNIVVEYLRLTDLVFED